MVCVSLSEDNSPSLGIFLVVHNDPGTGPVDRRSLPLAGRLLFCLLSFPQSVQVGGLTAVLPVTRLYLHSAESDQIAERPLDRRARKGQIRRNGADGIPALALTVAPVMEV